MGLFSSEPLRTNERVYQVDEDADRHDRAQGIVQGHKRRLSEVVAGIGIGNRNRDQRASGGDENHVKHGESLLSASER
ncbi:MAG TPA: hypothetical protein V6C72_15445 [Chroococcales cyanobacterium]